MPTRTKYRRRSTRTNGNSRLAVYSKAGYQLAQDVAYLGSLVNSELHLHTTNASGTISPLGEIITLCNIPVSSAKVGRNGNSVLPRYMNVNLNILKSADGASVDHETIRIILFRYWGQDTEQDPEIPFVDSILDTVDVLAFLNNNNTGGFGKRGRRIEIKQSKLFTLNKFTNSSRMFRWNVKTNGPKTPLDMKSHIKFQGTALDEPISGGYYLLLMTDNVTGTLEATFSHNSSIHFYDN